MSEAKFKAGDLLRLKSGGPLMTVVECLGEVVRCTWFNDKVLKSHEFRASMLTGKEPAELTEEELTPEIKLQGEEADKG